MISSGLDVTNSHTITIFEVESLAKIEKMMNFLGHKKFSFFVKLWSADGHKKFRENDEISGLLFGPFSREKRESLVGEVPCLPLSFFTCWSRYALERLVAFSFSFSQ